MSAVTQQTPQSDSYVIGFNTGAKYAEATKSHMLSSNRVPAAAHAYFIQASRAISVEQEDFEKGWQAGYQAFFDGIN